MRKMLTAMLAAGFVAGFAGAGFACPYHSAEVEKTLTTAQSGQPAAQEESAMSTHDPDALEIGEKVKAE